MIHVRGLVKDFHTGSGATVRAVDRVDLEVAPAEIVGFLGPNGAGKTTTQRMLTTLLPPDSGTAIVAGHDVRTEPFAVRRNIGYVGQVGGGNTDCTVREELLHHGRLHRLRGRHLTRRVSQVMTQLGLHELGNRQGKSLSGGQRRRFEIALGMVHEPKLLFLDEPTTGLDPQGRVNLWDYVDYLRYEGTTVFLTTHYLDEADALCDRLLIIDQGRIIADGDPEKLKANLGDTVTAYVTPDDTWPALEAARSWPATWDVTITEQLMRCVVTPGAAGELVTELYSSDVRLWDLTVHRPTLDDVFLSLTGRSLREP